MPKTHHIDLRNLMFYETKSCLQHQRFHNTHKRQWGHLCLISLVSSTSGRLPTVVNLRRKSLFYCLPWNDSKQTTEQLLSTSINTEKQFKAKAICL